MTLPNSFPAVTLVALFAGCSSSGETSAPGLDLAAADQATNGDLRAQPDAVAADALSTADAAISDWTTDDFERSSLGPKWLVIYPGATNTQVRIVGDSDVGMGPGPEGFFLINRISPVFGVDQFCEATIPTDVTDGWAHQVYVRWRPSDAARYGFGYDNDPSQPQFKSWYFKYDGVPGPQTRYFATAPATVTPQPGDTLRVEIRGYTLRGYLNNTLVLQATDTDVTKIATGVPGLAARWANGNTATPSTVKVWESWAGGSL